MVKPLAICPVRYCGLFQPGNASRFPAAVSSCHEACLWCKCVGEIPRKHPSRLHLYKGNILKWLENYYFFPFSFLIRQPGKYKKNKSITFPSDTCQGLEVSKAHLSLSSCPNGFIGHPVNIPDSRPTALREWRRLETITGIFRIAVSLCFTDSLKVSRQL